MAAGILALSAVCCKDIFSSFVSDCRLLFHIPCLLIVISRQTKNKICGASNDYILFKYMKVLKACKCSGNTVGSLTSATPAKILQQQLGKSSLADVWQG